MRPHRVTLEPNSTALLLGREEAAAFCGFTLQTFEAWVRNGLLSDPVDGGWTSEALVEALDRLARDGFQPHSRIPNIQRQKRADSLGVKRNHYYRRGMPGALPGDPGSATFMQALIAKEREFARQHAATSPTEAPPARPPALRTNQSPSAPQPSPGPASAPQSVTRDIANTKEARQRHHHSSPPLAPTIVGAPKAAPDDAAGPLPPVRPITTSPPAQPELSTVRRLRQSVSGTHPQATVPWKEPTSLPIYLTEAELIERYRNTISPGTLRNWRHQKVGPPATRIGRAILYRLDLIEAYEERQLSRSVDPPSAKVQPPNRKVSG